MAALVLAPAAFACDKDGKGDHTACAEGKDCCKKGAAKTASAEHKAACAKKGAGCSKKGAAAVAAADSKPNPAEMAKLAGYAADGCDKSAAKIVAMAKASGCEKTAAMAAKAEAGDKEAMTELLATVKKHSAELAAQEGEKPSMAALYATVSLGAGPGR